jgi:hypothetical protein
MLGTEDLIAIAQGNNVYESSMRLYLVDTLYAFVKRAINAANYGTPTGTISETFTIVFSVYRNGSEVYVFLKGCRARNVTITGETGQPTEVTIDLAHTSITVAAAHGLTTPTFASAPSGAVWGHLDGGANAVSYGGTALADMTGISVSINRNTTPVHVHGNADPHSTLPHGRRIGGDYTGLWTARVIVNSKTIEGLQASPETSAQSLAWVLKSATSTLTITGAVFVTYRRDSDADATDAQLEQAGFRGLTATLS